MSKIFQYLLAFSILASSAVVFGAEKDHKMHDHKKHEMMKDQHEEMKDSE